MYNNQVKILVKDISSELTGTLWFRKPKASEMIRMAEEQTALQDENAERVKQGLSEKQVSSGLVAVMEELVSNCFISGQDGEVEISKEDFQNNFLDLASVLYIFSKLSDTEGLEKKKLVS